MDKTDRILDVSLTICFLLAALIYLINMFKGVYTEAEISIATMLFTGICLVNYKVSLIQRLASESSHRI